MDMARAFSVLIMPESLRSVRHIWPYSSCSASFLEAIKTLRFSPRISDRCSEYASQTVWNLSFSCLPLMRKSITRMKPCKCVSSPLVSSVKVEYGLYGVADRSRTQLSVLSFKNFFDSNAPSLWSFSSTSIRSLNL